MRKSGAQMHSSHKGRQAAASTKTRGHPLRDKGSGAFSSGGSHYDGSSMAQSQINEEEEESKRFSSRVSENNQGEQSLRSQSENLDTDSEEDEDDDDILIKPEDLIFRSKNNERKWLRSHGKSHMIDFSDAEMKKLHQCFVSLVDNDQEESIGVDELEDPLIALGLVDNRQQVQQIVQLVDEDGSKMIEFNEFLDIIKGGSRMNNRQSGLGVQGTSAIFDFFKKLTTGKLQNPQEQELPFSLFISSKRRQKLLDSMMAEDSKKREEGEHILNNYRKQLAERMAREKVDRGDIFEKHMSSRGGDTSYNGEAEDKLTDFMTRRMANFENEVPDSNVLLAILARKGKFDNDLKSELRR